MCYILPDGYVIRFFFIFSAWFAVWIAFYARRITLYPFSHERSIKLLDYLKLTPTQQSALVGIFFTNIAIGFYTFLLSGCLNWLWIPIAHFALAGGGFYFLYNVNRWDRDCRGLPDRINQAWFYTMLFCLPPILTMAFHGWLVFGSVEFLVVPAICYVISGGPMIAAQEVKYQFQWESAKLAGELIDELKRGSNCEDNNFEVVAQHRLGH